MTLPNQLFAARVGRRTFLGLGAATMAGVVASCAPGGHETPSDAPTRAPSPSGSPDITSSPGESERPEPGSRFRPEPSPGVAAVGIAYLFRFPRTRLADLSPWLPADATDDETADAQLARSSAAIRSDFLAGRTVRLDGWVLSVTEARIAAYAMHRGRGTGGGAQPGDPPPIVTEFP